MKVQPRPRTGVLVLLAYLAAFYGVWIITGIDYARIGENSSTLSRWYVAPLAAGAVVLVVATTVLGWWRPALSEAGRRAPRWVLVTPAIMAVLAIVNLAGKDLSRTTGAMWVLLVLGSIGVGFCEELATRGVLIVGLRGGLAERGVWLWSSALFGLLHLPNMVFGSGAAAVPQVFLAFLTGSTFYLLRRGSGSLVPCMVLHAFWDLASFAGTGGSLVALVSIPVGIVSVAVVLVLLRREAARPAAPGPDPSRMTA